MDEAALSEYLDRRMPSRAPVKVTRHRAGHSNETFFVTRGDRRWVLRRPPRGAFLPTAHDVGREYRAMAALQRTIARVPRTHLYCADESVIGAPFYLMERVEGVVVRDRAPKGFGPGARAGFGTELVDTLAELHSLDPATLDVPGGARPGGYLERQLRRWSGQLELTLPHTRPIPDLETVGAWLAANKPQSPPPTVVHGDYKLDNALFSPRPPARLEVMLDWEMATVGDPLADLGWLISFWPDSPGADDLLARMTPVGTEPGFTARAELVRRYGERTGLELAGLDWYEVLAVWKLAILLEGSYARHLSGATDDPFFAELGRAVPQLALRARKVAAA